MPRVLSLSPLASITLAVALAAPGCGGRGDIGRVAGTVTLGGQPLADAVVTFQPTGAAPSRAITDASGRYSLRYTRDLAGAKIGAHVVSISTHRPANPDADPPRPLVPERVPSRYRGEDSELRARVAAGANAIDFPLEAEAEPQPRQKLASR